MSAEQKAKEKAAYLDEWLRRAQATKELVPEVQRQREETEWAISAAAELDKHAPSEIQAKVVKSLDRDILLTYRHLPMPPDYPQPQTVVLTTTSTASSSSAIFISLSDLSPRGSPEAQAALDRYMALQKKRGRVADARARLGQHLPTLLDLFDEAQKCLTFAQVSETDVPKAALEIRNLLEKSRAELLSKARAPGNPRENMTWPEMARRLSADPSLCQTLTDQEGIRSGLLDDLSELLKRRSPPDKDRISTVWASVVDHIYVTCGCL